MKRLNQIIVLVLSLSFCHISGQVKYDTISKDSNEEVVGGQYFEYCFVFKDIRESFPQSIKVPIIPEHYKHEGMVIVETYLGKDCKAHDTKVLRSVNPIFDSIAFYVIDNLTGWLPGMNRGRFISIPITIPFIFQNDSLINLEKLIESWSTHSDEEEYCNRLGKMEFLISEDPDLPITPNKELFQEFLLEYFSNNTYTYLIDYKPPKYRNRIKLSTNLNRNVAVLYLREKNKDHVLYSIHNPENVLLDITKQYVAIAYLKHRNEGSYVAINEINPSKTKEITFDFNINKKALFIEKLKEYAP